MRRREGRGGGKREKRGGGRREGKEGERRKERGGGRRERKGGGKRERKGGGGGREGTKETTSGSYCIRSSHQGCTNSPPSCAQLFLSPDDWKIDGLMIGGWMD